MEGKRRKDKTETLVHSMAVKAEMQRDSPGLLVFQSFSMRNEAKISIFQTEKQIPLWWFE